ncbi:cytochrome b translation regulator Cbp7 [Schizosaccharomyces osmophilus]|uniref:Cytochrome b translation regulator Cbp7 n=1 Tax=Schizosaccharomyces osmophilus TaxID=2545709 RepID=A0AAE9WDG5_9SCHI|nr:cytochrome b translation regulator Cbp7 [Schizosaccharomyces osmophilus]WBW74407.1 cytochrome b translation regulator Cbp7 [Schizosaccharomyces osmophilus]
MVNQFRKCILGPVNAGYTLAYSSLIKQGVDRPFMFYPKPFRKYRARNFLNIYKEDPNVSDPPEKVGHLEYKEADKMPTIDCLLVDSCITKTRKTIRQVKPLLHKDSSVILLNQDISLWMEYNSIFEDPLNRPKLYLGKFQNFSSQKPENVIQTSSLPYLRLCGMPAGRKFDWDTSRIQTINRLPEELDQVLNLNPLGNTEILSAKHFLTEQVCDLVILTTKSLPNPQMKRNAIYSWLDLISRLPFFGHLDKSLLSFDALYQSTFLKPVTFLNVPPSNAKIFSKYQCMKTLLKFATPCASDDTLHSFLGHLVNFSVRNYNTLFPSSMPEPPPHLFSTTKRIPLPNMSD